MIDSVLEKKLISLNYSKLWPDYGFLTLEELDNQFNVFENSDDKSTEHYRYRTFRKFLESKNSFTDAEIETFVSLIRIDEDEMMGSAVLLDVIRGKTLTDYQFEKLCNELSSFGESTFKITLHQRLFRKLKNEPFTEKLFLECFNNGNGAIHIALIKFANKEQLKVIAEKGLNKQARNLAKQQLRSKKLK